MNGLFEEFRILLHGVWHRRWLALAVAWAICLIGWLIVSMIPNSYESQARVFVQMRTILPDSGGIEAVQRQKDIDRVRGTLTSTVNLEKVVRGTDLSLKATSPTAITARAAGLQKSIKVVADPLQEGTFQITATAKQTDMSDAQNAKLARDIVQKLIDIFVEENLAGDRAVNSQSLKFLDAQLAEREKQLQDADQKRLAFEQQYMGLLPGAGSMADRLQASRAEVSRIEADLVSAQSALTTVNAQIAGTAASTAMPGMGGVAGPAATRLAQIEGQLADARTRGWTDAYPDVIALKNQLGSARAAAATEQRSGGAVGASAANPLYISLRAMQAEKQATVAALTARKNQIQSDTNQLIERQDADPGVMAEQARINRDYEVLKQQYDKMLTDREQVKLRGQVQSETDAVSFKVIDPPAQPRVPVAPNRILLLALVLIVGIGGGVGTAFAMGQLKTTYTTADRLAKASGLPVIGSITEMLTDAQRAERRKRMKWFAGGTAGLAGAFVLLLLVEFVQRGMVA
jgi:succinoglycan biosynthesis transport protein ExoP